MTAEQQWRRTVRDQLGLGRILPLGGPQDGAWIAESAAVTALRRSVTGQVPGTRLGAVRLALADPEHAPEPVVEPPASALPPGPLRLTADFSALPAEPLPALAGRLRAALAAAAGEAGLVVAEVDLRVTGLLEQAPDDPVVPLPDRSGIVDAALAGVEGVLAGSVLLEERHTRGGTGGAHPHARVELSVRADLRFLDVARAARTAVWERLPGRPTAAVLIRAIGA